VRAALTGGANGRGRRGLRRVARTERGVALVEFALLLPFLALIVFGTIDAGRGFIQQNRLKNASREGAALARVRPNCSTNITTRSLAEGDALPNAAVTVAREDGVAIAQVCAPATVPPANRVPGGTPILVRVEADFSLITPFVGAVTGNPIRQRAETRVVVHE
jgi:Flp pilus assembly protein TadG